MNRTIAIILTAIFVLTQASTSFALRAKEPEGPADSRASGMATAMSRGTPQPAAATGRAQTLQRIARILGLANVPVKKALEGEGICTLKEIWWLPNRKEAVAVYSVPKDKNSTNEYVLLRAPGSPYHERIILLNSSDVMKDDLYNREVVTTIGYAEQIAASQPAAASGEAQAAGVDVEVIKSRLEKLLPYRHLDSYPTSADRFAGINRGNVSNDAKNIADSLNKLLLGTDVAYEKLIYSFFFSQLISNDILFQVWIEEFGKLLNISETQKTANDFIAYINDRGASKARTLAGGKSRVVVLRKLTEAMSTLSAGGAAQAKVELANSPVLVVSVDGIVPTDIMQFLTTNDFEGATDRFADKNITGKTTVEYELSKEAYDRFYDPIIHINKDGTYSFTSIYIAEPLPVANNIDELRQRVQTWVSV